MLQDRKIYCSLAGPASFSPEILQAGAVKRLKPCYLKTILKIIIIMYIYHALINALSAHIIYININMIFYTHVEHSPTNLHKVLQ